MSTLNLNDFWQTDFAERVSEVGTLKSLLQSASDDREILFDLTFYSVFANRTLEIMRREGNKVQGFDRMQQSFTDAVEKILAGLQRLQANGFPDARGYLATEPESFAKLLLLIGDLSLVKSWMLHAEGDVL